MFEMIKNTFPCRNVSLEKQIKNQSSQEAAAQLQRENEKVKEKELEKLR